MAQLKSIPFMILEREILRFNCMRLTKIETGNWIYFNYSKELKWKLNFIICEDECKSVL